jgi:D-alanyl-lipoteichoic acid acyltransferase DltB (MBOAT superfamily)
MNIDFSRLLDQFIYHAKEPLIFNSGLFLFLFLGFMAGFYFVYKNHTLKLAYVILFSLFFYYKSSGIYFLILIASTVVDYLLADQIYKSTSTTRKKIWLVISLVINLGMLAYFKYSNFFYELFCSATDTKFEAFDIFLPVGVSFFTFQSLSYTIEIYRGDIEPEKNIINYAFFVSFFPQLVAGPIVRAKDFLPQVRMQPLVTFAMLGEGVFLIITGLFKKAIVSDYISVNFVERIFDNPTLYSGLENLFGVYGYALQIYCDFSGYSDMAIGIALLFGYRLCLNFNSPYQSANITEFWRRWHISLSSWLKDYLYISLGGNRKGKVRMYFNLMLTMLLGGLWHGASLRFLLWGGLHGVALAGHKYITDYGPKINPKPWHKYIGIFITFHFVCFCWIFFRATSMNNAYEVLAQIFTEFSPQVLVPFIEGYPLVLGFLILGYLLHFAPEKFEIRFKAEIINLPLAVKALALVVMIFLVIQIKSSEIQPFIYFQF